MSKKVVNKTNLIIVIVLLFSISLYYSVQGNTIFDRFFSFSPPQKNLIEPEVYSNIQGIISPSLTERISNFQISLIVEDLGDAEVSTQNLFINGQLIEAQVTEEVSGNLKIYKFGGTNLFLDFNEGINNLKIEYSIDGKEKVFRQEVIKDFESPQVLADLERNIIIVKEEESGVYENKIFEVVDGKFEEADVLKIESQDANDIIYSYALPDSANDFVFMASDNGLNSEVVSLISGKDYREISDEVREINLKKAREFLELNGNGDNENLLSVDCSIQNQAVYIRTAEKDGGINYSFWKKGNPDGEDTEHENQFKDEISSGNAIIRAAISQNQVKVPLVIEPDENEDTGITELPSDYYDSLPEELKLILVKYDENCSICDHFGNNPQMYSQCFKTCNQILEIDREGPDFYNDAPTPPYDKKVVLFYAMMANGKDWKDVGKYIRENYYPNKDVLPVMVIDQIVSDPLSTEGFINGLADTGNGIVWIGFEPNKFYNYFYYAYAHEALGHAYGLGHSSETNNIMFWTDEVLGHFLDFEQAIRLRAGARYCTSDGTENTGEEGNNAGFFPLTAGKLYESLPNVMNNSCEGSRLLERWEGIFPPIPEWGIVHPEFCENTFSDYVAPNEFTTHQLGKGDQGSPLSYCRVLNSDEGIKVNVVAAGPHNIEELKADPRYKDNIKFCIPRGFGVSSFNDCSCQTYGDIIQEKPGAVFPPGWTIGPAGPLPPPPPPQPFTPLPAGKKACEDVTEVPSSGGGHNCPNAVCTKEKEECKPNPMAGATKCKCVEEGKFPKCGDGYIYYNEDWTIDRIVCPPNDCKTDFGEDHECVGEITDGGTRFPGDEVAECFCKPIQPAGN